MNYLVWADIETTGLDPDLDHILELGLVLTKLDDFTPIAEHKQLLPAPTERMDDYVRAMHAKSGLLAALPAFQAGDPFYGNAERLALHFLIENGVEPRQGYLAGSSVHFDRSFLRHRMPAFVAHLSHRQVDVSSFKIMFPKLAPPKIEPAHRALPDIAESMGELRHYLWNLKVATPTTWACKLCGSNAAPFPGAIFCGAACVARAGA